MEPDRHTSSGADERKQIQLVRIISRLSIGGPAQHVLWLTETLKQQGYDTTLLTGALDTGEGSMHELADRLDVTPIEISQMQRSLHPLRDLSSLLSVMKVIRKARPTVVHTHTAKAGALGRLAAWILGVPVRVHTYHGHVFHGYFSKSKTRFFLAVERFLAKRTHRLIAVSEEVRQDIIRLGVCKEDQIEFISLGLELDRFADLDSVRGRFRAELGLGDDQRLVGTVARFAPIKGLFVLIDAIKQVCETNQRDHFVLVGDGELTDQLKAYVEDLGLADRITLPGFRRDTEVVFADLDLFVLSSFNEGQPVAILESLSAGVPVVATNVGGVPTLLNGVESGRLVEPNDHTALAKAIEAALTDTETAKAAAETYREPTQKYYSVGRLSRDLDSLYRSLMPAKSPTKSLQEEA